MTPTESNVDPILDSYIRISLGESDAKLFRLIVGNSWEVRLSQSKWNALDLNLTLVNHSCALNAAEQRVDLILAKMMLLTKFLVVS